MYAAAESGAGYWPEFTLYISSHFLMEEISDSLVESRALQDWEEKERNAMVASIARITMTTINSTNVNARFKIQDSRLMRADFAF